jgi:alkylation response protein AidB-like acyl-CoA dehydrogenase
MTALFLEKGMKDLLSGKKRIKLKAGTAELIFDDCRIPDANRSGRSWSRFYSNEKF